MPHARTRLDSRAIRVAAAALVGALFLALVPSQADAHRLSKSRAKQAAKAESEALANALHGMTTEDGGVFDVSDYGWGNCRRRSGHRFLCTIGNQGTVTYPDGSVFDYVCVNDLSVALRASRSRRLRLRYVGEPICDAQPRATASWRRSPSAGAADGDVTRAVGRAR